MAAAKERKNAVNARIPSLHSNSTSIATNPMD
jgi:hypothetical protein